ncbi:MAG: hypothetical protein HY595_03810, partial [Candidatus Omnitrophica bacterium]|nr:hypothetical protein [Candidatus Omnitrophota bacterium]
GQTPAVSDPLTDFRTRSGTAAPPAEGQATGAGPTTVETPEQCVTGDTLLPIRREGGGAVAYVPIVDVQPGEAVLSLNETTGRLEWRRIAGRLELGIKPVYRLTTASGRTIRTTGTHPYLTLSGWRKVSELSSGDWIRVAMSHYGEGNSLKPVSSRTKSLPLSLASGTAANNFLSEATMGDKRGGWISTWMIPAYREGGYASSSVKSASRLMRMRSSVWAKRMTAPFLVPAGTRSASWLMRRSTPMSRTSTSSSIRNRMPGGLEGGGAAALDRLASELERRVQMLGADHGVAGLDILVRLADFQQFEDGRDHDATPLEGRFAMADSGIYTDVVAPLNESAHHAFSIPTGYSIVNTETAWDRIVAIDPLLPEPVYDIEVEGTHNFVAGHWLEPSPSVSRVFGGLLAHNTLLSSSKGSSAARPSPAGEGVLSDPAKSGGAEGPPAKGPPSDRSEPSREPRPSSRTEPLYYDEQAGDLNLTLLEGLVAEAAQKAGEQLGFHVEALIVGGTRYLRTSIRPDFDVLLIEDPSRTFQYYRVREAFIEALGQLVRSYPDVSVSSYEKGWTVWVNTPRRAFRVGWQVSPNAQWRTAHPNWKEERVIERLREYLGKRVEYRNLEGRDREVAFYDFRRTLQYYVAAEFYFGDDAIWRRMRDRFLSIEDDDAAAWQAFLSDPERLERERLLLAQLSDEAQQPVIFDGIRRHLAELLSNLPHPRFRSSTPLPEADARTTSDTTALNAPTAPPAESSGASSDGKELPPPSVQVIRRDAHEQRLIAKYLSVPIHEVEELSADEHRDAVALAQEAFHRNYLALADDPALAPVMNVLHLKGIETAQSQAGGPAASHRSDADRTWFDVVDLSPNNERVLREHGFLLEPSHDWRNPLFDEAPSQRLARIGFSRGPNEPMERVVARWHEVLQLIRPQGRSLVPGEELPEDRRGGEGLPAVSPATSAARPSPQGEEVLSERERAEGPPAAELQPHRIRVVSTTDVTEQLAAFKRRLDAPMQRGTGWVRIAATPQEARDFHRTWSSNTPGQFELLFAGASYAVPLRVWEKMVAWVTRTPDLERQGYFLAKVGEGGYRVLDFIPLGSYVTDPEGVSRDPKTAQLTFSVDYLSKEVAEALGVDLTVQQSLYFRAIAGHQPLAVSIAVHSHWESSAYSHGPSPEDQAGESMKTHAGVVYCLGSQEGYLYDHAGVVRIGRTFPSDTIEGTVEDTLRARDEAERRH